ncbi:MAG TPA: flagellar M-ring protein FliF C-terminal domain-containing protein [Thermohalobaculum sp.]|nr:flagellar M-ring protein FliF C-terminal domain-containing protein [Thermohalobaculum sp.]
MNSVTVKTRIASAKESDSPRSEIQRQRVRQAGAIRRISVAVLVDGITAQADGGEPVWEARPAEELAALRQLVIAAIGYDEGRGDIVTVESMQFQPDATPGALVEASPWMRLLERNAMTLIQIGVLAVVTLVLALAVVRPILTRPMPALLPAGREIAAIAGPGAGAEGGGAGTPVRTGEIVTDSAEPERIPDSERLRLAATEKPEQTVSTLHDWLTSTEGEAA